MATYLTVCITGDVLRMKICERPGLLFCDAVGNGLAGFAPSIRTLRVRFATSAPNVRPSGKETVGCAFDRPELSVTVFPEMAEMVRVSPASNAPIAVGTIKTSSPASQPTGVTSRITDVAPALKLFVARAQPVLAAPKT